MGFQALDQHVIELCRADDLADGYVGKTVEQAAQCRVPGSARQKAGVIGKARDEVLDMVAELGVSTVDVRQVRIGGAALLRFRRAHRVGVDIGPGEDRFGSPARGQSTHGKYLVEGGAAVSRKQADRHDRIGENISRRIGSLFLGVRRVVRGGGVEDRFQIDRHRMVAGGDHVLLVHVGGGETMQQRKPGAGTPEKQLAAGRVRAGVLDEFRPTVAVTGDRAHGFQLHRGSGRVQPLDQSVPGDIEPQILRLVDDARAVHEADDAHRATAVMRVGKIAFDPGHPSAGRRM